MGFRENSIRLFPVFVGLTLAAEISNFISFVSPSWIQSIPEAHSHFQNIGLWTACFNGYMRPTYFGKAYYGCYYIYYVGYDGIRDWINPAWLYAIQTLSSLGILLQSLVTFVVLCQVTYSIHRDNLTVMKCCLVGHFITAFTLAASLVAFAVARYDSRWMPFPQFNVLSWSYAVAVISFTATVASFVIGFLRYMYLEALAWDRDSLLPTDRGFNKQNVQHSPSYDRFLGTQQLSEDEDNPQYFGRLEEYGNEQLPPQRLETSSRALVDNYH
ncbi:unnamed protein product [Dicrocoelium dendriticum]|nr:unnamed protein product [Dicrocoelium dendriticum]